MKEYIRRAKAWRNREWMRSNEGRPKSYLISLLVVKACENADRQGMPVHVAQYQKMTYLQPNMTGILGGWQRAPLPTPAQR